MTKRESEIVQLIKENALFSQNELAEKLGITRSSVAVHLSNLMKKGLLKGKGYIVNENPYICILGGANIDIVGFSKHKLIFKDANLGSLKISMGGVGRNIAENLVRLGLETKLICVLGDDLYAKKVIEHSQQTGIDIQDSLFVKDKHSSVHLAIMDAENDLALGLSAMDIYDEMNVAFIRKKKVKIQHASVVVLDTNISEDVLAWVVQNISEQHYFLDTVSVTKALKAKPLLPYLHTIKCNVLEAEALTKYKITSQKKIHEAAYFFHQLGIQQVFITQGEKGVFFSDGKISGQIKPQKVTVINTNGAGDAFVAGVVYAHIHKMNIKKAVHIGMACATMAVSDEDTVNPKIEENIILKMID